MKVSEQCGIAASKGNPLYKAVVRPHLEYCIHAWRPYPKKVVDTLEQTQRRSTKMIPEL